MTEREHRPTKTAIALWNVPERDVHCDCEERECCEHGKDPPRGCCGLLVSAGEFNSFPGCKSSESANCDVEHEDHQRPETECAKTHSDEHVDELGKVVRQRRMSRVFSG